MKVNVAQQLKSPLGDIRYYSIDETTGEGLPIQGEAKLVRTNRSILVTGRFRTVIKSTCSRCLEEFECPLEFEIEEEYFPTRDIISGLPTPLAEDVDGFIIGEDHVLDLSEAVRQNILLNLPTKPVCQPKCAGLCHKCGYNLNYGPCHCPEEQFDLRWSPLRTLISDEVAGSKTRG